MKRFEKNHIEINPEVCGGKPHIMGHRIRVQDIVIWHEKLSRTPDDIIQLYPSLSFADIFAALSFYYDNKEQIDMDIEEDEKFYDSLKKNYPSRLNQIIKSLKVEQN